MLTDAGFEALFGGQSAKGVEEVGREGTGSATK